MSLSSFLGSPSIGQRKTNFLVRTRKQFAEHGFLVATVDAPEDSPKMNPPWRMGDKHAVDISAVIAFLKQQADVPVWAVGTSFGTFSAANMGIRLKDTIHGVILTSSITDIPRKYDLYKSYPRGVINMELDKVTGPVFIASAEHDGCPRTPVGDDVQREFVDRLNENIVDMNAVREQQDWSALKDKLVGAEGA